MLTPSYIPGAAIAYGLYNQFQDSEISFGVYMLFIGVAMAITVCLIFVPSSCLNCRLNAYFCAFSHRPSQFWQES